MPDPRCSALMLLFPLLCLSLSLSSVLGSLPDSRCVLSRDQRNSGSCLTLQVQTQVTGLPVIYSSVLLRNLRRRRLIGAGGWLHHNLWGSQRARTRSLRGIKRCLHSRIHYGIHWLYFLASPLDSYPAGSACFFQLRH